MQHCKIWFMVRSRLKLHDLINSILVSYIFEIVKINKLSFSKRYKLWFIWFIFSDFLISSKIVASISTLLKVIVWKLQKNWFIWNPHHYYQPIIELSAKTIFLVKYSVHFARNVHTASKYVTVAYFPSSINYDSFNFIFY